MTFRQIVVENRDAKTALNTQRRCNILNVENLKIMYIKSKFLIKFTMLDFNNRIAKI